MKMFHELGSPESAPELRTKRVENNKISSLLYNSVEEILHMSSKYMEEKVG